MSVTAEELEDFHRFGAELLGREDRELSWDELFVLWESRNNHGDVNNGIREGLADIGNGQFQSADEALAETREEFDLSE